ncbi:iron-containing alcohol dehydrogenase, partial [mine drainage metagenome]
HRGDDVGARSRLLVASSMAILAFGFSLNAIPVHNMAHAFGGRFGIPHGLANAVLLPSVMDALRPFYLRRTRPLAEALGVRDLPDEPEACLDALVGFLRELRSSVGLPDTFAEFRLDRGALSDMVDLVHADPAGVAYELPAEVVERVTEAVSQV